MMNPLLRFSVSVASGLSGCLPQLGTADARRFLSEHRETRFPRLEL